MDLREKFYAEVEIRGECHIWIGLPHSDGYGWAYHPVTNKKTLAHRLAWELFRGPLPKGAQVLHTCPGGDNRKCVNVEHLRLGTNRENIDDAMARGGRDARLTRDAVVEIRKAHAVGGVSYADLGVRFGVSGAMIGYVIRRKYWAHVD